MAVQVWVLEGIPTGFTEVWRHNVAVDSDLSRLRARLRTELTGSAIVAHPEREHWSERLVLVVDELASNGLRHGRPPVDAALSRSGDDWLIAVTDMSADTPPAPATDRDPSLGGFGLHLVAQLARRHGWCVGNGTKTVWAEMAATSADN